MVTISHNGQKVSGVQLSPSFGLKIGVIALTQKAMVTFGREWDLASDEDEMMVDDMDEVWARGRKRHEAAANGERSKEGEVPQAAILTQKKEHLEEDDFLSHIWGTSSQSVVRGGGGTSAKFAASSSRAGPELVRFTGTDFPKSPANANKLPADRLKILQATRQVLFASPANYYIFRR